MIARTIIALCCLFPLTAIGQAAAPAPLQGNSVIVSWSENRTQRRDDEAQLRTVNVNVQLLVYVSTAGRVFSRMNRSLAGGGTQSASRERGPGESLTGGAGRARFEGRKLIIDSVYRGGGARRIVVSFDGSYGSCGAEIIQGKESGQPMRMTSMITGRKLEVHAISIGSPSCGVRSGNVFGQ
jgi:hypothetical protein